MVEDSNQPVAEPRQQVLLATSPDLTDGLKRELSVHGFAPVVTENLLVTSSEHQPTAIVCELTPEREAQLLEVAKEATLKQCVLVLIGPTRHQELFRRDLTVELSADVNVHEIARVCHQLVLGAHTVINAPPTLSQPSTPFSSLPLPPEPSNEAVVPSSLIPPSRSSARSIPPESGQASQTDAKQHNPAHLAPSELSPELDALLTETEERVVAEMQLASPKSGVTAEAEVGLVLSAEVRAALEEPIGASETQLQHEPAPLPATATNTGLGTSVLTEQQPLTNLCERQSTPELQEATQSVSSNPDQDSASGSRGYESDALAPITTRPPPPIHANRVWEEVVRQKDPSTLAISAPTVPRELRLEVSDVAPATSLIEPTRDGPVSSGGSPPEFPELTPGDAISVLANAVQTRFSGAVAYEAAEGVRRVVLKDGDIVTAASGAIGEALLEYLAEAGVIAHSVHTQMSHRVPKFGRHAGAALIAAGHLGRDQLWPVLRAHAEFVVGKICTLEHGAAALEREVPERLEAEPAVFGGATGSEVLVEAVRRVVPPETAKAQLGGPATRLKPGASYHLLEECALSRSEREALDWCLELPLDEALERTPSGEFPCVLYALICLSVIAAERPELPEPVTPHKENLAGEALRSRVLARRALIDNGDYFAVLGVPRDANGTHIRRAYLGLRAQFDPSNALTAETLDLQDDIILIGHVLDEAYDILGDPLRRDRYRRAIEPVP